MNYVPIRKSREQYSLVVNSTFLRPCIERRLRKQMKQQNWVKKFDRIVRAKCQSLVNKRRSHEQTECRWFRRFLGNRRKKRTHENAMSDWKEFNYYYSINTCSNRAFCIWRGRFRFISRRFRQRQRKPGNNLNAHETSTAPSAFLFRISFCFRRWYNYCAILLSIIRTSRSHLAVDTNRVSCFKYEVSCLSPVESAHLSKLCATLKTKGWTTDWK